MKRDELKQLVRQVIEESFESESTLNDETDSGSLWNEEDVEVKTSSKYIDVRFESNVETNEYKLFVEDELICSGEFGGGGVESVDYEKGDEFDLVNTIYSLMGSNFK